VQLGNGLFEHTNFNARLQPTQIGLGTTTTGATSISVLGLDYSFGTTNNNGNVLSQTITVPNGSGGTVSMIQNYSYDQVNRLSVATETVGGSSQWSQTYNYDVFGNRWVNSSTGYQLSLLTPTATNHINSLNNRSQMGSSHYDPAGNLDIDATGSTFTYDGENRQVTATIINGQPATYSYDGDGHRVMKTVGSGGSAVTTVFVYDAMGKLIAEYRSDSAQPPNGGGTSYLTTDHLGSTRVVTKQDKSVQARYDYLPFGEELGAGIGSRSSAMKYSATDATRQKFTSKERDSESGLDYFLARYYSSAQGRFTSPDEFTGGPHDLYYLSDAPVNPTFYADLFEPQSFNKYQYGYNNPLRYVDLDGHQPGAAAEALSLGTSVATGARVGSRFGPWGIVGGVAASVAYFVVMKAVEQNPNMDDCRSCATNLEGAQHRLARDAENERNAKEQTSQQTQPQGQQPGQPQGPRFEPSDKHSPKDRGKVSRGPTDGQAALDKSVQVKGTSPRRVGVDRDNKEIVVLDQTREGIYHGHVRSWNDLTQQQRNTLIKAGLVDKKGSIQ